MDVKTWNQVLELKSELKPGEFAAAARFKARLEFARDIRAFVGDNIQPATENGYFALTKLGMAYSTVEALERVVGAGWQLKVREPAISFAIENGELHALVRHLIRAAERHERGRPEELRVYENGNFVDELMPLVKHARNVMFHGAITPATVELHTRKRQTLVLALADATLDMVDREFKNWVNQVRISRNLKA